MQTPSRVRTVVPVLCRIRTTNTTALCWQRYELLPRTRVFKVPWRPNTPSSTPIPLPHVPRPISSLIDGHNSTLYTFTKQRVVLFFDFFYFFFHPLVLALSLLLQSVHRPATSPLYRSSISLCSSRPRRTRPQGPLLCIKTKLELKSATHFNFFAAFSRTVPAKF